MPSRIMRRRRGAIHPHPGIIIPALVGSIGAAVQSSSAGAAVNPAFGQSPTAGNLLILWWAVTAINTLPSTPSGWTSVIASAAGTQSRAVIFAKVAAGGDTAPSSLSVASGFSTCQLAEFSGTSGGVTADKTASAVGTTATITATAGSADTQNGNELVIVCGGSRYSVAGTKTLTHTVTPATVTINSTNNNATSSLNHYALGYGLTAGNGSAASDAFAATSGSLSGSAVAMATFQHA